MFRRPPSQKRTQQLLLLAWPDPGRAAGSYGHGLDGTKVPLSRQAVVRRHWKGANVGLQDEQALRTVPRTVLPAARPGCVFPRLSFHVRRTSFFPLFSSPYLPLASFLQPEQQLRSVLANRRNLNRRQLVMLQFVVAAGA